MSSVVIPAEKWYSIKKPYISLSIKIVILIGKLMVILVLFTDAV